MNSNNKNICPSLRWAMIKKNGNTQCCQVWEGNKQPHPTQRQSVQWLRPFEGQLGRSMPLIQPFLAWKCILQNHLHKCTKTYVKEIATATLFRPGVGKLFSKRKYFQLCKLHSVTATEVSLLGQKICK